jgi:hypothetical protein
VTTGETCYVDKIKGDDDRLGRGMPVSWGLVDVSSSVGEGRNGHPMGSALSGMREDGARCGGDGSALLGHDDADWMALNRRWPTSYSVSVRLGP